MVEDCSAQPKTLPLLIVMASDLKLWSTRRSLCCLYASQQSHTRFTLNFGSSWFSGLESLARGSAEPSTAQRCGAQESECARTGTSCVPHVQNWAVLPVPLSQTELLFPHSLAEPMDSLSPRGLLAAKKASVSPSSQVG